MRILIVGAGAVGGYFGGRLAQAGRDVTFLVRPRRAALLQAKGLVLRSPLGDFHLPEPRLATAETLAVETLAAPFDLIVLSCKAYDLDDAMTSFAPAVGATTTILPLLNGMAHIDALSKRFGADKVLGGLCMIGSTVDSDGAIAHLNRMHGLTYGDLPGAATQRAADVATVLDNAGFDARRSATILHDMWDKWIFIAGLAGATCLMRATVGDIVAAGAADLSLALFDECVAIAAANGFAPDADHVERTRNTLAEPGSPATASMLRDIEAGARIEADQILGDLLRRAGAGAGGRSLLRIATAQGKAYEARRLRKLNG